MNCPKCRTALAPTNIRNTEVDRCANCRGIWFDDHELQTLLDLAPTELRPIRAGKREANVDRQKAKCPRDQTNLVRVCSAIKPDIIVDYCPECRGIWLDGGEFNELLT